MCYYNHIESTIIHPIKPLRIAMFTTEIQTIAGLPVTMSEPVCTERSFFVTGYDKSTYEIHSRTVAQWELQIGDHKEVMQIIDVTNNDINKPFVSLATIPAFEPFIHLGNVAVAIPEETLLTMNEEGVFYKSAFKGIDKSVSSVFNTPFAKKDVIAIARLMHDAWRYVIEFMMKTNFTDTRMICETTYNQTHNLITKSFNELIDHEIIWEVVDIDEVDPTTTGDLVARNQDNPLIAAQILREHKTNVAHNLHAAEQGMFKTMADLDNPDKPLNEEQAQQLQAKLKTYHARYNSAKERLATNAKASNRMRLIR